MSTVDTIKKSVTELDLPENRKVSGSVAVLEVLCLLAKVYDRNPSLKVKWDLFLRGE